MRSVSLMSHHTREPAVPQTGRCVRGKVESGCGGRWGLSRCDRQAPRSAVQHPPRRTPSRETRVAVPCPSAERGRVCRSAANPTRERFRCHMDPRWRQLPNKVGFVALRQTPIHHHPFPELRAIRRSSRVPRVPIRQHGPGVPPPVKTGAPPQGGVTRFPDRQPGPHGCSATRLQAH